MAQAFDPKMLLAPKTAKKHASVPPQRSPANSFQLQPQRSSSADYNGTTMNGHTANGASLYERMHNVERRQESPPKRRKLNPQSEEEEASTKAKNAEHESRAVGSGDVGDFFKEKREEMRSEQGATATVVDLTEDKDEEIEVLSDNREREVCVGKIDGARINAHRIPSVGKSFTGMQKMWPSQKLTLTRRPGSNTHIIGVVDGSNKDFGTIDVRTASALAPLMDHYKTSKVRISARLDPRPRKAWEMPGQAVSDHYSITLLVYCPYNMVNGVGRIFSQRQIYLRTPQAGVAAGVEVVNPHEVKDYTPKQKAIAATTSRYSGTTQILRTQEEVRQDVFRMFDQLKPTDELPQAEQPSAVRTPLLAHQKQALYFMTEREKDKRNDLDTEDESSLWQKQEVRGRTSWYHVITGHETNEEPEPVLGGILADVMGLGKTLNVLSLVCDTREEAARFGLEKPPKARFEGDRTDLAFNNRATLLICPLSTVANWEEQIKQHIKKGNTKFTYLIYHGSNRAKDPEELLDVDLVITTYTTVSADARKRSQNRPRDVLGELHWFRVVLDEGHIIRSSSSGQAKAVCALSAQRRWAVTGTPVQNRLEDLGALMKFLRIRPFDELRAFGQYIIAPFKTADTEIIPKLRLLVDSITLRRQKDKIDLPDRREEHELLEMTDEEREFYNFYARESTKDLSVLVNRDKMSGKAMAHVLKAIMRMRLLCAGGSDLLSDEDWEAAQGFSANTAIDLEEINAKPDRTPRQAFELYRMMKDAGVNSCAKCDKFIAHQEILPEDEDEESTDEEDQDHTFGWLAQCNQLICNDCIEDFQRECTSVAGQDLHGHCPICESYTKFAFFELTQHSFELDEAAVQEIRKNPHLAKKAGRYSGPSAKTRRLIDELEHNRCESEKLIEKGEPPIKSVVFSGWTSHLDLIQIALTSSKVFFVRLDGKMSRKQRANVLEEFSNNPETTCILVSISAGGLGLNLTAASRVYVMEPQFNPAAEAQAIERVHRLGQKRDVVIKKYIMKNSFEQKMVLLQDRKKKLADLSIEKGAKFDKHEKAKQRMEELRTLFK